MQWLAGPEHRGDHAASVSLGAPFGKGYGGSPDGVVRCPPQAGAIDSLKYIRRWNAVCGGLFRANNKVSAEESFTFVRGFNAFNNNCCRSAGWKGRYCR